MHWPTFADAAFRLFRELGSLARDERARREAEPCIWAYYHRIMVGRTRWPRRAWHRRRARHYKALCSAVRKARQHAEA